MEKNIRQLYEELNDKLADFGAGYREFKATCAGDIRVAGFHVEVYFPCRAQVSQGMLTEIEGILAEYFGPIKRRTNLKTITWGNTGKKEKSITFYTEED